MEEINYANIEKNQSEKFHHQGQFVLYKKDTKTELGEEVTFIPVWHIILRTVTKVRGAVAEEGTRRI